MGSCMMTWKRPHPAGRISDSVDAPPVPADPDLRVAEADRAAAVDLLGRHVGEGRLDLDEYEQRVGEALAARSGRDLAAALRDLPPLPRQAVPRTPAEVRADRRAALRPFLSVMALLVVIWAVTGAGYFWPVWPLLGWGIPVLLAVVGGGRHGGGAHRPSTAAG